MIGSSAAAAADDEVMRLPRQGRDSWRLTATAG
jgi:hypothetical protein